MLKKFTMLGMPYDPNKHKINGWYVSEKLDGCRAMWLPGFYGQEVPFSNEPGIEATGLWSRDGKVIHAPDWWIRMLPNYPLDGELYLDRQSFQKTMSYIRKKRGLDDEWQHIRFMAFDIPVLMEAGTIDFKNRKVPIQTTKLHPTLSKQLPFRFCYDGLLSKIEENSVLKVVPQVRVKNKEHLDQMMQDVLAVGGEGLMLRNPDSIWTQGRVDFLLKVKPTLTMEVTVMGYYYGDGKYDGMMGALEVTDGKRIFKVSGFTNEERRIETVGEPFRRSIYDDCVFKAGSKIEIEYRELTKDGIPKEARYKRSN